jgi:hypothetical protein
MVLLPCTKVQGNLGDGGWVEVDIERFLYVNKSSR